MNLLNEIKEIGSLFKEKKPDTSSKDYVQKALKLKKKEREALENALLYIDEKNDPEFIATKGLFTKRALGLQKKHHSSISILKKLRKLKDVKHVYSMY